MPFAELIFKNLRQRAGRTALTVFGIAVAMAAITALWSIAWGYADSANSYYSARGVDIVVVRAGVSNRLTSSLSRDLVGPVASVAGVESVDGALTEMVSLGEANLLGIPLRGIDVSGFTIRSLSLREGRLLQPQDHRCVLLGASLADAMDMNAEEPIEIEGTRFLAVGIFRADNPFDSNSVVARLEDVQELMDRPGIVSELQVHTSASVRDSGSLQRVCRAIESLQDDHHRPLGLKAQPTHEFVEDASEAKLTSAMAWATTAIVVALSALGMLNTMLMSVIERTRELGVLRAIGWRRSRIMWMILGESAMMSLIGIVLGTATAWVLIRLLSHWPRTSLLVPANLSAPTVVPGIAAAILACIAGAAYPALRATIVTPIESLRYE